MVTDIRYQVALINEEIKNTKIFLASNPSPEEKLKLEELLVLLLEKLDQLYSPQKRTA